MDKLKTSFVVKVDAEVSLNMAEVEIVKQKKVNGEEILRVDLVKKEIANTLGIPESCVEVIEHSEELIEGIGE